MKVNIAIETLKYNREWFRFDDLERMGFISGDVVSSNDLYVHIEVDKKNTHYGIDYSDSQFISSRGLYNDKAELLIKKENIKHLIEFSNSQFFKGITIFKKQYSAFHSNKEKLIRKETKNDVQKFLQAFPNMDLPNEFFKRTAKRRYEIVYLRKAIKLVKKFKRAIKENKKVLINLNKI